MAEGDDTGFMGKDRKGKEGGADRGVDGGVGAQARALSAQTPIKLAVCHV